jgi:hypothetical protein
MKAKQTKPTQQKKTEGRQKNNKTTKPTLQRKTERRQVNNKTYETHTAKENRGKTRK